MHLSVTCSFLVPMCINICMCGKLFPYFSPVCLFYGLVMMWLIVVVGCVHCLSVAPVDCIPLLSTCGTDLTKQRGRSVGREKMELAALWLYRTATSPEGRCSHSCATNPALIMLNNQGNQYTYVFLVLPGHRGVVFMWLSLIVYREIKSF